MTATPALPRHPGLLTADDLPLAELQALALDGEVFRLDQAFCSVAELDVPWRRARALVDVFGDEFVVAGRSAAWVWGALACAPATHEAIGETRRTKRDVPVGMRVRSVVLSEGDTVDFGVVAVTSPVRTIVDVVRGDVFDGEDARLIASLARQHQVDRSACDGVLDRVKSLPHKRRARRRLDDAGLVDAGLVDAGPDDAGPNDAGPKGSESAAPESISRR
jgi:hypothetical protein